MLYKLKVPTNGLVQIQHIKEHCLDTTCDVVELYSSIGLCCLKLEQDILRQKYPYIYMIALWQLSLIAADRTSVSIFLYTQNTRSFMKLESQ